MFDALDKRNLLSHTYWSDVAREAETLIKERYYPVLLRLYAGSGRQADAMTDGLKDAHRDAIIADDRGQRPCGTGRAVRISSDWD